MPVQFLLLVSILLSCTGSTNERRTYNAASDVLIRYYQNGIAIHHIESGNFAFCQVCFSGLGELPEDELLRDVQIHVNYETGKIEVFDSNGKVVKTYSKDSEINDRLILGVGHVVGQYPSGNSDPGYLGPSNHGGDPPVLELSCQCVPQTSTPCGPGGSNLDDCDVGGENANACSVMSGQQATVGLVILGTGPTMGAGSSNGCSVSCGEGTYACCNY